MVFFIHRRTYRWKGDNSRVFQGPGKLLALYADGSMNVYSVIILYAASLCFVPLSVCVSLSIFLKWMVSFFCFGFVFKAGEKAFKGCSIFLLLS